MRGEQGKAPARRRLAALLKISALVCGAVFVSARAEPGAKPLQSKTPPLTTPWTSQVSKTAPLPEYPRPQMVRSEWQSLNGQWQFAPASDGFSPPFNKRLAETVLVPFPIESALSGIGRHEDQMWYRRTFSVPGSWKGRRVRLNFGAVDYSANVYVNGQKVGDHSGGYDSFGFDITPYLGSGANELIVGVYDPTNTGGQPIGKQRLDPEGIFYTPSSGIWQTVWLEPVAQAHVARLDLTPDVQGGALRVTVRGAGTSGQAVELVAKSGGTVVSRASGRVGAQIKLPVPNAHLWTPDDPFLYTLTVRLRSGNKTLDTVQSYFGMRSIGLKVVDGTLRPVLNGKFVFQIGTLDQGFWPDGIYTAPTDAALKSDLQKHKDLGFNTVRKHIKVEPQRWYYWADKLGLLVWQDMPAMDNNKAPSLPDQAEFEREWHTIIDQHRSSPSIVTWVDLNEGWGQFDQARLADEVKKWDPSRLVDNMSGINCCGSVDGGNGDLADWHVYVGPASPVPEQKRAAVLGEFGGLGLRVRGHEWQPGKGFSYEMQKDAPALLTRYLGLIATTKRLMTNAGLSAAIYTEITDVENEVNGFLTYDRKVLKMDAARVKAAHRDLIAASNAPGTAAKVTLPLNALRSLRPADAANQSALAVDGQGVVQKVSADSSGEIKQAASFKIVAGLANPACYSFQSSADPSLYLRHRDFRLHVEGVDGSDSFTRDATFCPQPGFSGGVSLAAFNFPALYIRDFQGELWMAEKGGPHPWDAAANYERDASWTVGDSWAP